jgi:hypothetical protein
MADDVTYGKKDMSDRKDQTHRDLEADALMALEQARKLKPGPKRAAAMKRAGSLRHAADLQGIFFAQRGRPPKS